MNINLTEHEKSLLVVGMYWFGCEYGEKNPGIRSAIPQIMMSLGLYHRFIEMGKSAVENRAPDFLADFALPGDFEPKKEESEGYKDAVIEAANEASKANGWALEEWTVALHAVTYHITGILAGELKIDQVEAQKWYDDGFTAYQCFRETWDNENDTH